MVFYAWFYCERAWCRNCQPGRYASSQSALPEAEVLDTIYQYADTPTARTAHDFRVASALGGDALIKALEKMENARGTKTGKLVILDGGGFERLKWKKETEWFCWY